MSTEREDRENRRNDVRRVDDRDMPDLVDRVEKIAGAVDAAQKVIRPIWGLFIGLIIATTIVVKFYWDWQDTAINGSPALRKVISGLQENLNATNNNVEETKTSNKLLKLEVEMEREEFNRRISRIEDDKYGKLK